MLKSNRNFEALGEKYGSNNWSNNIFSGKKEKCIMTPLSFVAAVCFWITALV